MLFRNASESFQARSSRAVGIAESRESAFGEFTAKPNEFLAAFTLGASARRVAGAPLFRSLSGRTRYTGLEDHGARGGL